MKRITITILLTLVTLFTGCDLSFKPEKPVVNGSGEISQVQVNIGGNARTLLPDLSDGFSKYVLSAESANNSQNPPQPVMVNGGNSSGTIAIPYGEWIITATAYVSVNGTEYPAAKGSAPLTVDSDYHNVTIVINLPESGGIGTFNYTVRYPASGSVVITLTPMGGGAPVFNTSVSSGTPGSSNVVPSGIYFLTVAATVNGITSTISEIVHIYPRSATNAEFTFTKLDFGDTNLNLSGTVKVLVNGIQPSQARLYFSTDQNNWSGTYINFSGNNGSGTWDISPSNLGGATTLYLRAGPFYSMAKELQSIPIPVDDITGIDLGTVEFTVTSLTASTWSNGDITIANSEDWYSINVTAGTRYYFWLNNAYRVDGSKTLYGYFELYHSNGGHYFSTRTAWYDPASFTADDSGTVYIRVRGNWDNTGTYAIGYSINAYWHNNTLIPANAVPLSADTWRDGEIVTPYTADLYAINVTEGTTYFFWWNEYYYGDGTKTLSLDVYAYTSDWDYIIYNSNYNSNGTWDDPRYFIAAYTGTVYIRVRANGGDGYTGTYAIGYSTNGFWHNNSFDPSNPTQLNINTWVNGDITTPNAEDWYLINVTAGTTYYLWRNDSNHGDGSKTLPVGIYVYGSGGNLIFESPTSYWDPVTFTAGYSGTVYLRVRNLNGWSSTGTYAIIYSDRPRGNVGITIRTAFEANDYLYLNYASEVYPWSTLWASVDYSYPSWIWTNYYPVVTYSWYIDGVRQNGLTNYEINLPRAGLSLGIHYVLAVVTIDDAQFSREFSFQVYEN